MRQNHKPTKSSSTGKTGQVRVVSFHGNRAIVLVDGVETKAHVRRGAGTLVAGDLVELESSDAKPTVCKRLERRSELSRPDQYGKVRTLAANIDQFIVTVAVEPPPDFTLIDQYLVAASIQGIEPVLVINKVDKELNGDKTNSVSVSAVKQEFSSLVDNIISVSTKTETGIGELKELLTDKTSVFAGQSGVGKSSIVNMLLPHAEADTSALSLSDGLGQHTTTTPKLYPLTCSGWIIDSPGIRELTLHKISPSELASGYEEISSKSGQCRFRNCLHTQEPDCAVTDAVAKGEVSKRRYKSYLALLAQMQEK